MRDGESIGRSPWRARRLRALLLAGAALAWLVIGFVPLTAGTSQADAVEAFITLAPTSGRLNTPITITLGGLWRPDVGTTTRIPCEVTFLWNGNPWITTAVPGNPGQTASGAVPATAVLGAANTITAQCIDGNTGALLGAVTAAFTVKSPTWTLTDNPGTAVAGQATNVTLTARNNAPGNPPCTLAYSLDGHALGSHGSSYVDALAAATSVGAHTFKIVCSTGLLAGSATVGFTVTPAPTTTTTRATSTTSKSTGTTAKGATTTTAKGATTTTAKGATTTTGKGSSSSSSTSVSIDSTPTTVPGEAPVTKNTYLKLTALAIAPGAQVAANGKGCDAGAPVALSIGSRSVGHTRASPSGAFHAPLTLGALSVGRYTVVAHCGPILAAPLDIVLASQVSAATSTLAIIIFALLIGALAFRRQISPRRPRPTAASPSTTEPPS